MRSAMPFCQPYPCLWATAIDRTHIATAILVSASTRDEKVIDVIAHERTLSHLAKHNGSITIKESDAAKALA